MIIQMGGAAIAVAFVIGYFGINSIVNRIDELLHKNAVKKDRDQD